MDVAVLFAELERAGGAAQADIARQYRKSAGYVSVLCRLGAALRTLPPEERTALRVRPVTFKAVQAVVSRYRRADEILGALRELAASRPAPRRRRAAGGAGLWREPPAARPDEDLLDPVPLPAALAEARAADFVYRWDDAAAVRDPAAALAAYEAFVRRMTEEVVGRLRHAAGTPLGRRAARGGAAAPPGAVDEAAGIALDVSLRQLDERVAATLKAHREQMDRFLAERGAPRAAGGGPPGGWPGAGAPPRAAPPIEVTPEELEADFRDGD